MIQELQEMGIQLMVSIWPTVDRRIGELSSRCWRRATLIRTDRGVRAALWSSRGIPFITTPPIPRPGSLCGIPPKPTTTTKACGVFWLDEAEPEYSVYDFDNYRYYLGPNVKVGNSYPVCYAKAFYDGMKAAGPGEHHQPAALRLGRQPEATARWCGAAIFTPASKASCATSLPPA